MTPDQREANRRYAAWREPIDRFVSLAPVAAFLRRFMHRRDVHLMRLSKGRFNLTLGLPSVLLTTTGARSGRSHASPPLYVNLGEDIAIVGTRFGGNKDPGWVHNLNHDPHARIMLDGEEYAVTARPAKEEEREADRIYVGFAAYRKRVTARKIPMFVLVRD